MKGFDNLLSVSILEPRCKAYLGNEPQTISEKVTLAEGDTRPSASKNSKCKFLSFFIR